MEAQLNPLGQAILFEECRLLAAHLGGAVARPFEMCGLHDEQLMLTPATMPLPMEPPRPREEPPAPKNNMRNFEGTLLQGGEEANEAFEMLSQAWSHD